LVPQFTSEFKNLPQSLQVFFRDQLVPRLNPSRVILFGSRARGTSREISDYDFAVDGVVYGPALK
jgi:predicted nucleotidyltransferase